MNPQPELSLNGARSSMEMYINPPPKDFDVTKIYIPNHYRELSHNIIKQKLIKEIGKYPIQRKDTLWYSSKKLKLEFAMPKSKDPIVDKETLFYLHGGAYILGSNNTHRPLYCKLGRKANCQVAALNYRLAPEFPFPCALEDTLAAYLFLTSQSTAECPGMGIDATKIVIAGDSAGGGLSSSFLILLSQLDQYGMVAGALLLSPWVDIASTQPSIFTKNNDILPGPKLNGIKNYLFINELLASSCLYLKEEILNVNGHFYTNEKYLKYPLVSPMYQDDFDKFPPVMVTVGGEERFEDECMIFAYKLKSYNQRKSCSHQVILHIYEDMPHVFQSIWFHRSSKKSFKLCSQFIKDCFSNCSKNNNNLSWAYKIDRKLKLHPFDYDITGYSIPKAF
ncbi:alpha/beta-hydrolase [Neoconidiobolus thromboides FSU 785]|nr:alpha/beta-hydrolase [Neoconidiobolus thromboides FSU 785]